MLPKDFRKKLPIYIIALYIFFLGISYLLTVLVGLKSHAVARTVGSPIQSVLLGVALMYLSGSLLRGLYRAWLITFSMVGIAFVREVIIASLT